MGSEYGGSRGKVRNSACHIVICRKAHCATFTYEKEEMICNKPPQLVARPQRRPQS